MSAQATPLAATGRRLLILAILLLALALRCGGLDYQELRGDEAFGYFFSLSPFDEIVEQTLELNEPHPVASYWLQHAWMGVAGQSEFALRFGGVWWSVLAVALTVPLASQLGLSLLSGMTGMLLMALSPYLIWHAQDARMYNMSLSLTMLSTLLAIRWWRESGRPRRVWITLAYLLVTWLALHTHYFALYIVVAQNIALGGWAFFQSAWRKWLLWLGIGLLLFLLWLPWLVVAWGTLTNYQGNGDSPGLVEALTRAQSAFGVGEAIANDTRQWWALLALVAMGLGALVLWRIPQRTGRTALWFLLVYWLVPLAATWLSAQRRPIFNERYLVAIVPPVYLLMAAAVDSRRARGTRWWQWLGGITVALVICGMGFGTFRQMSDPRFSKTRGWRELATALEALTADIDPTAARLAQNYPDPTLWYYYQGDVPHLVLPPAPHDRTLAEEEVERFVEGGVGRVVLVEQPSGAWDSEEIAQAALSNDFTLAGTAEVARWPLSIWLRPTAEIEPVHVDYEDGLRLAGALVTPTLLSPGGVIEVFLQFYDEASTGGQEAVSVQLLNRDGELVAQQDHPLEMASLTTAAVASYAILLPMELAGGDYQLVLVVYDSSVAATPRHLTLAGADSYVLSPIRIVEKSRD